MSTLDFKPAVLAIDANVCVVAAGDSAGADRYSGPCSALDQISLLTEMDQRGIERAVCYHSHAMSRSARVGWQLLSEFIGERQPAPSRLIPQPCVLAVDDDLAFVRELHAQGKLNSVRLACPPEEKLLFIPAFYGELLGWLQEHRVPLFIGIDAIDFRDLVTSLQAFPRVPIVLTGAHYVHYQWIKPLMRSIPLLHLELSRYEAFGQVEDLLGEFGAGRLIYGSGYPAYAMGPVLFYLHHCNLNDQQLRLICGGNIQRLLKREGMPR